MKEISTCKIYVRWDDAFGNKKEQEFQKLYYAEKFARNLRNNCEVDRIKLVEVETIERELTV